MKILLVSWSILPYLGGSSVIVENLAQNFSSEELIVLGGKRLLQSVNVDRKPGSPLFRYFRSELSFFGRGYRFFNWFQKLRFPALVREIKTTIEKERITYVIGVFPNLHYCLAACRAAREMSIPFSAYFHNTFVENAEIDNPNRLTLQQEIFENSRHIFVMSKGMQQFYEQKYPQYKFTPLVHTFNSYPDQNSFTGIPGTHKDHYKLVAIGNFNESNMEATIRFAEAIESNPKYSLSLFTHVPKMLLQKRGLSTKLVNHQGLVKPHLVHKALQKFDIAVLTHGFSGGYGEVEYKTIFPTRTIPLLLSGKPIIAHSPSGSFLNQFIEEHQCAALVDQPCKKAINHQLEQISSNEAYQKDLVVAAQETSSLFYGPQVIRHFKKQLEKSVLMSNA